ncbi:MAG TPA: DUF2892 domain-containing protein [Solirubrobacterales bacterium]|nr:DUF2892 domain-containing protein [Solirubrobacterales bacterium]
MGTAATVDGPAKTRESGPAETRRRWPLERVLFLLAGTMTLLSVLLAAVVSPWFLLLTGFVGLNQLAFVSLGNCPSSWLLQRYGGFERGMPR